MFKHLLLFSFFLSQILASQSYQFFFGPVPEGEDSLADHFIQFISRAQKTLDGAFYEFRDDRFVNAFIDLHQKGVHVRLITDNDNYYFRDPETHEIDKTRFNPFAQKLIDAGISLIQDNERSGLMHNKFCVIDASAVWTGSFNLTDSGYLRNENNAMQFFDEKLAEIYTREFEEMFTDKNFGIKSPSTVDQQSLSIDNAKIEVYFAPEDKPLEQIYRHVSMAEEEVHFMQFAMTANELGELLIEKKKAGLKVSGIFDKILYRSTGPYAEFSRLTQNDIPVVVYDSALGGKMHHKVFIIDPKGKHPKVIFGSLNASSNGALGNDENIMVIEDGEVAKAYYAKYKELFGKTSRVIASFKSIAPVHAASNIDRLTLIVSSNSVKTTQIKIQFPARWPKQQENLGMKIYRMKNGKAIDTTKKEEYYLNERDLLIKSADLEENGEKALIMIRMTDVLAPEIPGLYNLYVQAKSTFSPFYPLKSQPVIEVVDPETEAKFTDAQQNVFEALLERQYNGLENMLNQCETDGRCKSLSNFDFRMKLSQVLRQLILIQEDEKAQILLNRLLSLKLNDETNMNDSLKKHLDDVYGAQIADSLYEN